MQLKSYLPLIFLYTRGRESIDGATRFQKLVFLSQRETDLSEVYEFRADRFGPFSPALRSDLETLDEMGYIERTVVTNEYGNPKVIYGLTDEGYRTAQEKLSDSTETIYELVQSIKDEYNDQRLDDLLTYVYRKYDNYVTATEVDTKSLFDPDAESDFETPANTTGGSITIGEELQPTPHTLWQMPKRETCAYFYYLTDDTYAAEDSKFKVLDNQLTLLGRNRTGAEVAVIDRDRMRAELWKAIVEGLEIDSYPALIVAEGSLGIADLDMDARLFEPADVAYTTIENGFIKDEILRDADSVRDFLNTLFDASRDNKLQETMRKEKALTFLSIAKDGVEDILRVPI